AYPDVVPWWKHGHILFSSCFVFRFPPRSQSIFNPDYLLPSSPIKKLQIFLFPISVKSVFISFFMVSPNQQSVIAL
ncbi:hypothetical protein LI210_21875, partial [Parabacteroides distasonis]